MSETPLPMIDFLVCTAAEMRARPDYAQRYYELLDAWRAEVKKLSEAKAAEMTMRVLLAELTFGADRAEGSHTHRFGDDRKAPKLVLTQPYTRTLDAAALGPCLTALRDAIGAKADDVVRFKPDLGVGDYKKLTKEHQLLLAPALSTKPGSPSLKYEERKE